MFLKMQLYFKIPFGISAFISVTHLQEPKRKTSEEK